MKKKILLLLMLICFCFITLEARSENEIEQIPIKAVSGYHLLFDKFAENGFSGDEISKIFSDKRFVAYPKILAKGKVTNYFDPEYGLFKYSSIVRGRKTLKEKWQILQQAEERFNVEKEILISIFRIETDLGEYQSRYRVLGSLATMTLFQNRRADIFKKELICFIGLCKEKQWDILEIKGSSAGAFGLFQFLPTSYLNYAIDGNGDGKVDLFLFDDSIFSAANYLVRNGWKKGDLAKIKAALFSYNNDSDYVKAVLAYAETLK